MRCEQMFTSQIIITKMSTKEYITDKAFEVFMTKGYDSTSITVLQNELGMSRGAMYRHFTSKEELLKVVADKYVVGLMESLRNGLIDDDMTLMDMIQRYIYLLERVLRTVGRITGLKIKILNYTALCIQAAKVYPDFTDRMRNIGESITKGWKNAINNSIRKGEVREDADVDTLAYIYSSTFRSTAFGNENTLLVEVKDIERNMMYLYSLIKI